MNPIVLMELGTVMVIKLLVLMVILITLFLWFGAIGAGVSNITFGKVAIAAVAMIATQWIIAIGFSIIPLIGGLLGFIFSIVGVIYIIKMFFTIPWIQAGAVWTLAMIAEITSGMILSVYIGIDLIEFIHHFIFVF